MREYLTAAFHDVTAPNADTLYPSFGSIYPTNLTSGIPDSNGRYYLMPMLDAWTNVFQVPGKRNRDQGPCDHRSGAGEDSSSWVKEYKSPTNMIWIWGAPSYRHPQD